MEKSSSGEELVIKARKPYTITKQRERWTEEEHNKFLEAIKLYGRAWQRIEEHIGTKTAVQIRSHAQKFFSKLEKKALAKGVPVKQALDIDIPPPRPKRKPSNPYPRKSSMVVPMPQVGKKDGRGFKSSSKQGVNLEKEPLPKRYEVSNIFQKNGCSSAHSANESITREHLELKGPCTIKELISLQKEDNGSNEVLNMEISKPSEKSDEDKKEDDSTGGLGTDEILASLNNPGHVPVHVAHENVIGCSPSGEISFQGPLFQLTGDDHGCPNLSANPAASVNIDNPNNAPIPINHSLSIYSPFITTQSNQDEYHTFLHMSSTFSSLIVSTLLQNPAAHAAASFASSLWTHSNLNHCLGSSGCTQCGFLPKQMEYPLSMASIAAATVAAATAWWTAQGLLPLSTPLHSVAHSPAPTTAVPSTKLGQASSSKTKRVDDTSQSPPLQDQQLNPKHSEALQAQHLASKSHTVSPMGSEESEDAKQDGGGNVALLEKDAAATELLVPDKRKAGKQVDRSSSGSNTPSNSEVEGDAQKNCGRDNPKVPENDHTSGEPCYRCKSLAHMNETWKKVSEEGKLAFQGLFSRENAGKVYTGTKMLDLTSKTCEISDCNQVGGIDAEHDDNTKDSRPQTMGVANGKSKTSWAGFKPYKRCSVEAKESRAKVKSIQGADNGSKRTRLEEETSI